MSGRVLMVRLGDRWVCFSPPSSRFHGSGLPVPRRSCPDGGRLAFLVSTRLPLWGGGAGREFGKWLKLLFRAQFCVPRSTSGRDSLRCCFRSTSWICMRREQVWRPAPRPAWIQCAGWVSGLEVNPAQSHLGRDRGHSARPQGLLFPMPLRMAELHFGIRFRILQANLVVTLQPMLADFLCSWIPWMKCHSSLALSTSTLLPEIDLYLSFPLVPGMLGP